MHPTASSWLQTGVGLSGCRPAFDLLLLGYRNDLARERVLAYLRSLPESRAPCRSTATPRYRTCCDAGAVDHAPGCACSATCATAAPRSGWWPAPTTRRAAAAAAGAAGRRTGRAGTASRRAQRRDCCWLLVLFAFAAAMFVRLLPPRAGAAARSCRRHGVCRSPAAPVAVAAQLDAAPHRLNDEAVELNAAGQFADAAGKLREALRATPDEPALRRNLQHRAAQLGGGGAQRQPHRRAP